MDRRPGPGVRQAWVVSLSPATSLQLDHEYVYLTSLSLSFFFQIIAPASWAYSFTQRTLTDHLLPVKNLLDNGDSVANKGVKILPACCLCCSWLWLGLNEIMLWKCFALCLECSVKAFNKMNRKSINGWR